MPIFKRYFSGIMIQGNIFSSEFILTVPKVRRLKARCINRKTMILFILGEF